MGVARSGLQVRKCAMNFRKSCRQLAYSTLSATSVSADPGDRATSGHDGQHRSPEPAEIVATLSLKKSSDSDSDAEEKAATRRREAMEQMTNEELLRFGAQLRMDRETLEDRLGTLSKASEVIANLGEA